MNSKNNSLFELVYNEANNINEENLNIVDTIDVSYLDALKNKKVKVFVNQQIDCKCTSNEYVDDFYIDCNKCNGSGFLILNSNKVTCNRCKGRKKLIKSVCPLCNGRMYILDKKEMLINLNGTNSISIDKKGKSFNGVYGNLILNVNIFDKNAYIIKGKDVYSRKIIDFNKNEFDKAKEVETCVDYSKIKINAIKYEDVIKLSGKGLDGGDFYQPIRCEVKGEKGEDIYKNIILNTRKNKFYIKREDLYSKSLVINVYDYKPLNDPNYIYVDIDKMASYSIVKLEGMGKNGINNGDPGDLYLGIFIGDYSVINDDIYLNKCELSKGELSSSKKSIIVSGTKISVPFDKKKESNYFLDMGNYGLVVSKKERKKLFIRIPVVDREEYFIIANGMGYIVDYKKFFNEEVDVYKSNENLDEYICFSGEKTVYDSYGNKITVTLKKGVK